MNFKEEQIVYKNVDELIPYQNNPRINKEAVKYVSESIKNYGFRNPIILDKNDVIIAGHTRLESAKKLGFTQVPCIVADDLTEKQIKAFRLADNKVSEFSQWDNDLLNLELEELNNLDIDMSDFGFDLDDLESDTEYKENERHRTNDTYNLDLIDLENFTNNFWQMPIIQNDNHIPNDLIGFNYAKTSKDYGKGIHFYLDDYQFERLWNSPQDYVEVLNKYDCILSPDFSLYLDMPMPMKIWNIYRSRQIGKYYQDNGIKVIPTISWAEKETFSFCFEGIPKNSIVSISTIGVKQNKQSFEIWKDGVTELIDRIAPQVILVYGGAIDFDYKGTEIKYFENKVTERLKNNGR